MSLTIIAIGGIVLGIGLMLIALIVDDHHRPRRRSRKPLRHKTT